MTATPLDSVPEPRSATTDEESDVTTLFFYRVFFPLTRRLDQSKTKGEQTQSRRRLGANRGDRRNTSAPLFRPPGLLPLACCSLGAEVAMEAQLPVLAPTSLAEESARLAIPCAVRSGPRRHREDDPQKGDMKFGDFVFSRVSTSPWSQMMLTPGELFGSALHSVWWRLVML